MKLFKRPEVALLLAILAAVVVGAACYFLLIGPRKGEVDKIQKEIDSTEQKKQAEMATYKELLDIKNRSAEYEAKLAYLQSVIPQEPELPSLIRQLQAAADPGSGAGLPWLSFTPGDVAQGEGSYSTYTFSMSVGGFYDQVVDLVYRMERFPRAVTINDISITASTGFLNREFSANLGVVQAEIQAQTFTFAAPASTAAPSGTTTTPTPQTQPTPGPTPTQPSSTP